ncbi:MAG TPA: sterol desaturase family protein [Candidatus Cybelea sp.]|jgi:lathosterol oxidase|nr:sterol desaturase family protein [Candidatus Cybelea sp.]
MADKLVNGSVNNVKGIGWNSINGGFRLMRQGHHLSTNPTPRAAYDFDPLEAFVQAGIFPLVIFAYSLHPFAFFLFMGRQIAFNVFGRAGFEIFPRWFLDLWMGKGLETPTNHVMHHEYFIGNYGWYFNLWDRLMGTNHKNYETRFREVTSHAKNSASLA